MIGKVTGALESLFVDPPRWRCGVATLLVEAISRAAAAAGLRQLYVIANPPAEVFYQRTGFVRTGVTATRFGPAVTMLMEISQPD